jgi:hypothetical protein
LLSIGALRIVNPAFYKLAFENVRQANMKFFTGKESIDAISKAPSFLIAYCVGVIVLFAWFFLSWGAYRELNRLSKFRSFLAAIVFIPCFSLVSVLIFMMTAAVVK